MTETVLNIDQLSHSYGSSSILKEISLSISPNEYVGLVGINGAGKSTLIKSILDFVSIDAGQIQIFNRSHRLPAAREQLAFLPEKFQAPYYLKGRDFLQYMAELHSVRPADSEIDNIFKLLDLDISALDKSVRQYSKGMSQKLGLAACFLCQRPLLILDEPMSGLDPKARACLKQYLLMLKQQGCTLFFSTHLLNDVERLCDRIIILHDGRIQFDGSPSQCCETYAEATLESAYMKCIGAGAALTA